MIKIFRDRNLIALFCILLSIFIASISYGINIVAFCATLIKHDVSPFLIGIASAVEILAGVKISFILSKIIARLKIFYAVISFGAIYTISIALIFFYQNFYLWLFFCAINGICWFSLLVIRNAWINTLIKDANRSVILALTTTIFCSGFTLGSVIVKYLGAQNYSPFLLSSGLIAVSILVLILIKNTMPSKIDSRRIGFYEFFKHNPRISLSRFLLDFQNACLIALTIVFGIKIGLTPENAGLLIAAFMASGFFDLYAGFLVRKYNHYNMIKTGFITCLVLMIFAIFLHQSFIALIIIFFLFGAGTALIFVTSLTITNESFASEKLVAANSALQSIGSLGAVFGSVAGGLLIQFFDFYGFFITIILSEITYLIFTFFYEKTHAKN